MDPIPAPISPTAPYLTLNPHHFPITTSSPAAQEWFNRALTLTYAFSHEEALVCFYQVLAHDEACLMGYWGIAYALGANYNKTWELYAKGEVEKTVPHIRAALDQVKRRNLRGTELEQSLVHALDARMPQDLTNRDYSTWNTKYAHAMRDVYTRFPENIDVAAIFAESLMVLTPWRLWDLTTGLPAANSHAAEIRGILETAMATSEGRRHPGLLHFYIHLMEMSSTPELALPAANALPSLVPDAGHLQHMPSTSTSSSATTHAQSTPTSAVSPRMRRTCASRGGAAGSTSCIGSTTCSSSFTPPCSRDNTNSRWNMSR